MSTCLIGPSWISCLIVLGSLIQCCVISTMSCLCHIISGSQCIKKCALLTVKHIGLSLLVCFRGRPAVIISALLLCSISRSLSLALSLSLPPWVCCAAPPAQKQSGAAPPLDRSSNNRCPFIIAHISQIFRGKKSRNKITSVSAHTKT